MINGSNILCLDQCAIWLEWSLSSQHGAELSPYVLAFSHDNAKHAGGVKAKVTASKILRTIFHCDDFEINDYEDKGPLGMHLLQEFASTWVHEMVAQKMIKILMGSGKRSSRCQMIMMTWNFHTQIQELQECSLLVARVPIK